MRKKFSRAQLLRFDQLAVRIDEANAVIQKTADEIAWGSSGKDARVLSKFLRLLRRIEEGDRRLLLHMAQKMANR